MHIDRFRDVIHAKRFKSFRLNEEAAQVSIVVMKEDDVDTVVDELMNLLVHFCKHVEVESAEYAQWFHVSFSIVW